MPRAQLVPPQARTAGLIVREAGDEVLVYDETRCKAHCLNRAAALVWRACDGRRTVSAIAGSLDGSAPIQAREASVLLALRQLDAARLLEGRMDCLEGTAISRRKLIARLGVAAALSLPLVTSVARAGDGEVSCIGQGEPCNPADDFCCKGLTCAVPADVSGTIVEGICLPLPPP